MALETWQAAVVTWQGTPSVAFNQWALETLCEPGATWKQILVLVLALYGALCVDHAVGGQGLARGSRASRCSHASGALVVVPATAAVTTTTTDNHDQGGRRSHAPHGTIASTRTHGTNIASMCEATAPEAVGVQQHHALAQNPHHIRVPTVQAHDREVAGRLLPRLPWPLERVSARASTAAATGTTANASEPTSPAPPVQKDTENQTIRAVRE